VLVQPIYVAVDGEWKNPMVSQDNYRVKLKATGGLTPYTWKDFTIVGDTEGKLSWLTVQTDVDDPSIAYLTNRVENDVTLVPRKETTDSDVLKIKVTVLDKSKHGIMTDRLDNTGYPFEHAIIIKPSACENGDGFCPKQQCNISTDNDCPITCGDGVVSSGETCDTGISAGQEGACPTSCNDGVACTSDTLQNPGTCQAECVYTLITECKDGDSCCPASCSSINDDSCSAKCDNGVIDANETCDPKSTCPTSCSDGDMCTTDTLTGSVDNCNAACIYTTNKGCHSVGGCCPPSIEGVVYNMKYVPGGEFPTGTDDLGGNQIVGAFWIGETEVTYELWNAVYSRAAERVYTFANQGRQGGDSNTGSVGNNQHPVTTINWRDAMVWCNLASELAGLTAVYYTDVGLTTPIRSVDNNAVDSTTLTVGHEDNPYVKNDADGFRLPERMQWECAARYRGKDSTNSVNVGGTNWTKGNSASGATADYNDAAATGAVGWYNKSSTNEVGKLTPNAFDIHDMSGNVWEWCFDWYTSGANRVVRGGGWGLGADRLQVGFLGGDEPFFKGPGLGFRLVRTK
jgi:Uncharacterized conserved protein